MATLEEKGQTVSTERLKEFLREMLLIRRFEEKVEERFRAGELPGFLHVAIGQEAVAVGVCRALEDGDVIASTHRAHGHTLAKGTHPNEVMAELYGKVEGCSHGYGGSMHLYDVERGNLGANAVVGGGLPAIVGAALAFKMRGEPRVAVAFFGDGATNIGTFHEALNLAQLWSVPARLRLREQPLRGVDARQAAPADRGPDEAGRGLRDDVHDSRRPGRRGGLRDARRRRSSTRARARAPSSSSPNCVRLTGHYVGDPQVYRPKEELRELRQTQDPIENLRAAARALRRGVGGDGREATRSPRSPSSSPRGAPTRSPRTPSRTSMPEPTTYREAVRDAMSEAMRRDDDVFIMGEDIAEMGGSMGVTQGMLEEFGPERVRNTPISEMAIVGAGHRRGDRRACARSSRSCTRTSRRSRWSSS